MGQDSPPIFPKSAPRKISGNTPESADFIFCVSDRIQQSDIFLSIGAR